MTVRSIATLVLVASHAIACAHAQEEPPAVLALLGAGLGDAARNEALRAVTNNPEDANAWLLLGAARAHDAFGVEGGPGIDRAGAIEALRRASSLSNAPAARALWAHALLFGDDGHPMTPGADFRGAIRVLEGVLSEGKNDLAANDLVGALFWSERWADAARRAEELGPSPFRTAHRLAAIALAESPEVALQSLMQTLPSEERGAMLDATSTILMRALRFREARVFALAQRNSGAPISPLQQLTIERGATMRSREENAASLPSPERTVRELIWQGTVHGGDAPGHRALLIASRRDERVEPGFSPFAGFDIRGRMVVASLILATARIKVEGDDAAARVEVRHDVGKGGRLLAFVQREGGAFRVVTHGGGLWPLGERAFIACRERDLALARHWLTWAAKELSTKLAPDDPLSGPLFSRIWQAAASDDDVCAAAAVLAAEGSASVREAAIEVLRARGDGLGGTERAMWRVRIAATLIEMERDEEALAILDEILVAVPTSSTARAMRYRALLRLARTEELTREVDAQLATDPNDDEALRMLLSLPRAADIAVYRAASRLMRDAGVNAAGADNNLAWSLLFMENPGPDEITEAVALAERMALATPSRNRLNTLAAVYAMAGRTADAHAALKRSVGVDGLGVLTDWDRYILGRIYENLGRVDDARAVYAMIESQGAEPRGVRGAVNKRLREPSMVAAGSPPRASPR